MKKKLKKLNRGLLLGGIAILMTVCYVVVDNMTFSKSKSDIEQAAKLYIDDAFKANIVKDYDQPNAANTLRKSLTDVIQKNWTTHDIQTVSTDEYRAFESKSTILSQINNGFTGISTGLEVPKADKDPAVGVYDVSSSISKMTIRKYGPNSAQVEMDVHYTMYASGVGSFFAPGSSEFLDAEVIGLPFESSDPKFKETNEALANRTKCIKYTNDATYSILMTKDSGTWKVYGSTNYYYTSENATIVDFDAASKKPVEKDGKEDVSDEHSN